MKKILIMGATSGMGRRVAQDFARMGWRVGAAGRNEKALKELKEEYPDLIETEVIDVRRREAVKKMFKLINKMGGMDVFFNAAGVLYENEAMNVADEVNTLETNVVGFARVVAVAYRYFRDLERETGDGGGRIAAITSVASTRGVGTLASYSASKRFQREYLLAIEQLAHRQGVDVGITEIRPGWVRTPLTEPDRDYPMLMTMDYVVPMIEAAILKGKRVATIDWRWRALCWAWEAIPRCLYVRMDIPASTPRPEMAVDGKEGQPYMKPETPEAARHDVVE